MTRSQISAMLRHRFCSERTVDWWWSHARPDLAGLSADELWNSGCERTVVSLAMRVMERQ